uniref:Uncharacterized protein n=1 Tax=Echinococcus granulosus TaxID=6210 RepID=A0A068WQ38_ECHGR|nr:hypothetical protein EgrG_000507700 [Echinococcus granulosus]
MYWPNVGPLTSSSAIIWPIKHTLTPPATVLTFCQTRHPSIAFHLGNATTTPTQQQLPQQQPASICSHGEDSQPTMRTHHFHCSVSLSMSGTVLIPAPTLPHQSVHGTALPPLLCPTVLYSALLCSTPSYAALHCAVLCCAVPVLFSHEINPSQCFMQHH